MKDYRGIAIFKAIRGWYAAKKIRKSILAKEKLDEEIMWGEIKQISKISVYFPNGQFFCKINYIGNKKMILEDFIKSLIYENIKNGISYNEIINKLCDPDFKIY